MAPRRIGRFLRQRHTRGRGREGEREAVRWLRRQGFRIVATNATERTGEIDVVAREGDTLCFVEIKARSGPGYGSSLAAVTAAKQRRLARAASSWLVRHPWDGPCRFDVLGLDLEPGPNQGEEAAARDTRGWTFTLVRDAFSAPA